MLDCPRRIPRFCACADILPERSRRALEFTTGGAIDYAVAAAERACAHFYANSASARTRERVPSARRRLSLSLSFSRTRARFSSGLFFPEEVPVTGESCFSLFYSQCFHSGGYGVGEGDCLVSVE